MAKQDDVLKVLLAIGDERPKKEFSIKRLGVTFTLQSVDVDKLREQATFSTKNGKQVDTEKLQLLIIERGCVIPNWGDKAIIEKYGDAHSAIKKIILSGERERIATAILELSGYVDDEEEVKN